MQRVLIANRGEIAVRVIRACRELQLSPVAIYAAGEERAMHVRMADDAYLLPSGSGLPYLKVEAIIEIARRAGVDAIHPGYGFLSENAEFARSVTEAGITFVGPPADAISAMGDKIEARSIAIAAGVPTVAGSDGAVATLDEARQWASEHGYPVAVKAAGGGGGRGFRVAATEKELEDAFTGSSGEAARYFSNPTVYLERYLERPRHIEIQVFADSHDNVVSLGERDCSIQRRHQKLIEETPSPAVPPELRAALGEAAVALARAVDYQGAGTVEFLVTEKGELAFLEMNTRIQVEHTVTEEVTGIDLVKEQLRVASGEPLSFTEQEIQVRGHSIQCRINAEDPASDFRPTPGKVTRFVLPEGPGIRVETAMETGAEIQPAFDSMISKLVTWGRDRDEAISRMRRALTEFQVEGVPTTIPFHQAVMNNPLFVAGGATTSFLAEHPGVIPQTSTWSPSGADQDSDEGAPVQEVLVEVDGRQLTVRVHGLDLTESRPKKRRGSPPIALGNATNRNASAATELVSPLQGTVVRVSVDVGKQVEAGDLVCVIEAMKMENEVVAHRSGVVSSLAVTPGGSVGIGSTIAVID
jgi:acetyl-CoA/propionyl-CoA carboxylase, biotin carboxylase, biotin carboxyl carrier protein